MKQWNACLNYGRYTGLEKLKEHSIARCHQILEAEQGR